MKLIKLILLLILLANVADNFAQPNLSVEFEDENGPRLCDQSVNCNCAGSFIPVAFGDKEVMLSRTVVITLTNVGTGNLTIANASFSGSGNWSIAYAPAIGGGINLPAGGTLTITITFNPLNASSLGLDQANIILHTFVPDTCFEDADASTPDQLDVRFNLSGTVTKTPINYILALDRSGSMSGIWGTPERKIDKLRKAADFFVGLASLRPANTTQGFTGDRLGLVRYGSSADNYLPLAVVDPALVTDAREKLSEAASNDASRLRPSGSTNMRHAVQRAFDQFPADEKNVLIAFSDGMENVPPLTTDPSFVPVITGRASDVDIYSVGMGSDVNPASLEALSLNSGFTVPRYFFLPDDFTNGTSTVLNPNSSSFASLGSYELNSIYLKIYAEAAGYSIPNDPEKLVCLCGGSQMIFDTWITSSDKHAIFSLFHSPAVERKTYQLQLVNPQGNVITEGTMPGNLVSKVVSSPDYTIYKVEFSGADTASYVGKWNVRLISADSTKEVYVPIGFGSLAFSDLTMETNAATTGNTSGGAIMLGVNVKESGITLKQQVTDMLVRMLTPSGKIVNLIAEHDQHGQWRASFPDTYDRGVYTLFVRARLSNARGEFTTRESTSFVPVGFDHPTLSPAPCCKPHYVLWIILVIAVLILILIVVRVLRR